MPCYSSPEILALQEISTILISEKEVKNILDGVLQVLHKRLCMIRGTFTLLRKEELSIEVSHGLGDNEKKRGKYHLGEGITGHVAATGISHIIADISQEERFLNKTKTRPISEKIAFICVPIKRLGQVIGTLSIDSQADSPEKLESNKQFLEIVGNITAEALFSCQKEHEERQSLLEENQILRSRLEGNPGELVGNSRPMIQVFELIHQVAPSQATVLLRGSSGTGKEVAARALVKHSKRASKPFIALNCAALPENLIESELFGHEKGAFTGAITQRIGRVEAAEGGTLFLDEIGDLSPATQVKLLRLIQEKTFSRIGSNKELPANVRFIAATSRNLEALMSQGLFREDLYYRLNIFPIVLPDLCKRQSDILLLAEHFIEKHKLRYEKNITCLSPLAIDRLLTYSWPGNVRELENCMERAVLTCSSETIHAHHLPPSLQKVSAETEKPAPTNLYDKLEHYERDLILQALEAQEGKLSASARALGISPRMLHYKLKKLGLSPE